VEKKFIKTYVQLGAIGISDPGQELINLSLEKI
jgi:hypothetical protein